MGSNSYIEWYNANGGRAYPIAETASRVDEYNNRMDDDLIVDLGVMVPPGHANVYVSSLRITPRVVSIGISSDVSGLFIGTFARNSIRPMRALPLTGVVDGVTGWVAFGDGFLRPTVINVYHRFSSIAQSGLERRAVRVIQSIPVESIARFEGDPEELLQGIVELVGGGACVIEQDESNPQIIVLRLKYGAESRFTGPCAIDAAVDRCGVPPIRSILGVCPDAEGRIIIRFE